MLYVAIDNIIKSYQSGDDVFVDLLSLEPFPIFYYEVYVSQSVVPLWERHYNAIVLVAKALDLPVYNELFDYQIIIKRLVNKNKFFTGAIVRLIFLPFRNRLKVIAIPRKVNYKSFDSIGQLIVVKRLDNKLKKYFNDENFEFLRQFNIHNYIYNQTANKHHAFIFDLNNRILETTLGAILLFKNDSIISPTYKSGAFYNALQLEVLSRLRNQGYKIIENPIDYEDFDKADEVWIVKENYGIYYKVGIELYRYYFSEKHRKIINEINKAAFING